MGTESLSVKPSVSRRIAHRLAAGVTVHDDDPMDGGLLVSQWINLWQSTNQPTGYGFMRIEWPDGNSLIEQPALGVHMLELVGDQIMKHVREANGKP
jgi:hypothetical protein